MELAVTCAANGVERADVRRACNVQMCPRSSRVSFSTLPMRALLTAVSKSAQHMLLLFETTFTLLLMLDRT
jgi:hypothetical protein